MLAIAHINDMSVPLETGDLILQVQNIPVSTHDEVEIIVDGMLTGQSAKVTVLRDNYKFNADVILTKFYSDFYIISVLIAGLIYFSIAVIVLLKAPKTEASLVFHWVVIGTGVIIMTTWGNYAGLTSGLGHITRTAFHFSYIFVPSCFVHFTLVFPTKNYSEQRIYLWGMYLFSFFLFLALHCQYLIFVNLGTPIYLKLYSLFSNVARIYIVFCTISGIVIFLVSYKAASLVSEKKKFKWILFSLIVGPGSYILLWVIPQAIINYGLIPEEFVILLVSIVPVGFAIAIIRHHIFNIDIIINRSVVYSFLISCIVLFYIFLVYIAALFFDNISNPAFSILITSAVAFLFAPVKAKVQEFVDKKFFKIHYNFRIASKRLLEEIKNSGDISTLSDKVISELNNIIPVDKMGFYISKDNGSFQLVSAKDFDTNISDINFFEASGCAEKIETGAFINSVGDFQLMNKGVNLIFPIKSTKNILLGFLLIGSRKSGFLFTIEDIDLYNSVVTEAGIEIERLQLYESLIREQMEQEKLAEMNQLKSFFLSSVSHDLKTPITSIKMFAELLQVSMNNLRNEQKEEYSAIIIGECGRLSRLIDNILDLTKIEKGIKEYNFSVTDMKDLIRYAVGIMTFQIQLEKCTLDLRIPQEEGEEYLLLADSDSLISALVNLISNALKYSVSPKKISICIYQEENKAVFKIFNNGPELNTEELEHISQLFYRSKRSKEENIQGSGLGLYLVRQIVEAHNGTLLISNEPDNGCTFKITIPLWRQHAEDIID